MAPASSSIATQRTLASGPESVSSERRYQIRLGAPPFGPMLDAATGSTSMSVRGSMSVSRSNGSDGAVTTAATSGSKPTDSCGPTPGSAGSTDVAGARHRPSAHTSRSASSRWSQRSTLPQPSAAPDTVPTRTTGTDTP